MNWRFFLFPITWTYGIVIKIRNLLFENHILSTQTFSVPIITVGNIAVGGTGKTPHVEYLIRMLSSHYHIAILSRGYKRKTTGFKYVTTTSIVTDVGDEPLQFKQKFPDVTVAVDEKRAHGIQQLLKDDRNINLIILDDAFQHRYVKPDLSILLTEYSNLYADDYLMPVGQLREHRVGAKRADIIVVSKSPVNLSQEEQLDLLKKLQVKYHQYLFFSHIKYGKLQGVFHHETKEIPENAFIILVTGIANPNPLKQYLTKKHNHITHLSFPDHYAFKENDIKNIFKTYQNNINQQPIIITTEKDAMRLKDFASSNSIEKLPVYYLSIEIDFTEIQKEVFDKLIFKKISHN